jgi:biotin carboxylase
LVTKNKTILVFGAGINQLTLIDAAIKLGVKTVVIDPQENAPGKSIADIFYQVDVKDYELTKEIAIKEKVDGIVTSQMENPLRLMARLAEEMGYKFHTSDIIEQCRNKYLMKREFIRNSIPCANGVLINQDTKFTNNELLNNDLSFPLIVKPCDAFSSQGVMKVYDYEELYKSVEAASLFSTDRSVLIEEYLDGPEYSIETITYQGETDIIQFTEKIITTNEYCVELGHMQPANLNNELKKKLTKLVQKTISALNIDNSAAHVEVKLCEDGFKVVEVGARLGGDFISSYLTKASTGISMDKLAILVALGLSPKYKRSKEFHSCIKYVEFPIGKRIKTILPLNYLFGCEGFVFAYIFVKEGDVINTITNSALRPACVLVRSKSRKRVIHLANEYSKSILKHIIFN